MRRNAIEASRTTPPKSLDCRLCGSKIRRMKSLTEHLWFEVEGRRGFVNITGTVEQLVRRSGVREGLCLVDAMHITPDGKMPHESRSSPRETQNYLGRISGPLLDRIDLHVEAPQVKIREMSGERNGDTSVQIRERVIAARERQHTRFNGTRIPATRGWARVSRKNSACWMRPRANC